MLYQQEKAEDGNVVEFLLNDQRTKRKKERTDDDFFLRKLGLTCWMASASVGETDTGTWAEWAELLA